MNYIKELNSLFDFCMLNRLCKSEISLLRALYAINNKKDWAEWFEADNETVSRLTGGYSRETINEARNKLKQRGRLDFKEGARNIKAPKYKLIPFNRAVISDIQVDKEPDIQVDKEPDILVDPLSKQNKTKQNKNIPPMSPKGDWCKQFEIFWSFYPRKVGKGKAEEWFKKNKPSQKLLKTMLEAIKLQSKSEQWVKEKGQFIPHPTTWLNQERWRDAPEIEPVTANMGSVYDDLD